MIHASIMFLCVQNKAKLIPVTFKESLENWHERMRYAYFVTIQKSLRQAYIFVNDLS